MGGRKSKATVNARYRKMLAIEARRRARETAKQGPLPAKGVKKMIREGLLCQPHGSEHCKLCPKGKKSNSRSAALI